MIDRLFQRQVSPIEQEIDILLHKELLMFLSNGF